MNSAQSGGRLGNRPGPSWLGRSAVLLIAGLLPGLASALTAGQISVQSYLNEPFRALVPLRALQVGEAAELEVGLADDEAYRSLGLEKSLFLTSLQFEVREGTNAEQANLVITSTETAKEPFFSVLLAFDGLSGTLVREYTILLDPNTGQPRGQSAVAPESKAPVTREPAPQPEVAAAPVETPPQRTTQPVSRAPTQPVVRQSAPQADAQPFRSGDAERKVPVPTPNVFEGDTAAPATADPVATTVAFDNQPVSYASEFGPVKAGMTLWQIAAAVRPDPSVTMNQVMWGLYSTNPDQFDGNLNLVKRGAVLKVPSVQALRDVSPAEANALVADEAQRHRDGLSAAPAARGAATQQLELEQANPAVATPRPATRQVQPERQAAATAAPQVPEPTLEPLELVEDEAAERDSASVLPAADEAQRAQDNSAYEQLEALPDDEGEAGDYAELPSLPMDDEASQELAAEDAVDAALPALEDDASTDSGSQEYPNLFGLGLAALGVLILGLLVVFGLRRRNQGQDQGPVSDFASERPPQRKPVSDFAQAPAEASPSDELADTMAFEATATSDLDDTLTQEFGDTALQGAVDDTHDFDIPDLDDFVSGAEPKAADDTFGDTVQFDEPQGGAVEFGDTEVKPAAEAPVESAPEEMDFSELEMDSGTQTLDLGSETVSLELNEDPLSEADFQLAYGLYDEAALLLNRAIEAEPDRLELHEKLAETHFAASDADKFKQAAETLKARNPDAETWQRIAIMGQQLCPGDALFGDFEEAGDASVDLDMAFDSQDESAAPAADNSPLEFSLDDAPSASEDVAPQVAAEDDNVLEFSLDEAPAPDAPAAADLDDDFEADFGEFESDDAGADELPDLDELNLDDLEAELGDGAELEPASTPEETATSGPGSEALDDFADLTLSDVSETELGLDTQTGDAADVLGTGTDFQLDDQASDADETDTAFELELDQPSPSDNADELSLADVDASSELADELGAGDLTLSDDASELSLAGDDELSLSDDFAGADDDLDLGDLELSADDDGQATDFNLDDLSLEESADSADLSDLTLDDESDLSMDLGAEETDFNLDDLGGDAEDVAGGDESATKLDLARAYVDMGESDMARSLLEEVVAAGSEDQKADAQELLSKL